MMPFPSGLCHGIATATQTERGKKGTGVKHGQHQRLPQYCTWKDELYLVFHPRTFSKEHHLSGSTWKRPKSTCQSATLPVVTPQKHGLWPLLCVGSATKWFLHKSLGCSASLILHMQKGEKINEISSMRSQKQKNHPFHLSQLQPDILNSP
jgi:hypothetical protein